MQEKVPLLLEWAANHSDYTVVMTLLMNTKIPKTVLEKLIQNRQVEVVKEDYIPATRDPMWEGGYDGAEEAMKLSCNLEVCEAAKLHINWTEEIDENLDAVVKAAILKTTLSPSWDEEPTLWAIGVIPEFMLPILAPYLQEAIAKNPHTCIPILEQLVAQKASLRCYVTANSNLPLHLLLQLVGDDCADVRQSVAYHPKTSFTTLQQFRSQQTAVADANATVDLLAKLAESQWILIRQGVASHANTPVEILEQLAGDRDRRVRATVAKNSNTPTKILEELADDESQQVRESVAKNPNTPAQILELLGENISWRVRQAVASNPNIPVSLLEKLVVARNEPIRMAVAQNSCTSQEILKRIAKDEKDYIRELVAKNPNTSGEILELLATDEAAYAREAVACHANVPIRVLEQLATDSQATVRLAVTQHSKLPRVTLEQLAKDDNKYVGQTAGELLKTNFYPGSVWRMLRHPILINDDYYYDYRINLSHDAPSNLLEQLIEHPYGEYVRSAVARHPNTSIELLERLARDNKYWVRGKVAENGNSSGKILEQLAGDSHQYVREAVARNPNTTVGLLEQLAKDEDKKVRRAVASNPNTPIKIVVNMLQDYDSNDWGF